MTLPLILVAMAFLSMLAEARIAAAHDRALRAMGAVEPAGDVYRLMQIAYPACFLIMPAEAWWRGAQTGRMLASGVVVFALAKALKYWAIATLGPRWTFRVLVPQGSSCVTAGPYRWLRHPNYVAVLGELIGMAMMAQAPVTGAAAVVGFGLLILARIRVEERALGIRQT
ncbi:MAG: isoprenylcysteine carboxylmethyltransferase family protein [Acidobacteriota bacterium]